MTHKPLTPDPRRPYTAEIGMDALVKRADGSTINFGDAIYHPENADEARAYAARVAAPSDGLREALHANGIGCSKFHHDADAHRFDERIIRAALATPTEERTVTTTASGCGHIGCIGLATCATAPPADPGGLHCGDCGHYIHRPGPCQYIESPRSNPKPCYCAALSDLEAKIREVMP
jgi:hypothetical protein